MTRTLFEVEKLCEGVNRFNEYLKDNIEQSRNNKRPLIRSIDLPHPHLFQNNGDRIGPSVLLLKAVNAERSPSYSTEIRECKDCGLSERTINCLRGNDITTIGDLVSYKQSDLLKLRNFGRMALEEVRQLVRSKGLLWDKDANYDYSERI